MRELSEYGKFARYYKGRGKLIPESDDQEAVEYEFEAAQFVDGDMRLILLREGDLQGMGTFKDHIHFEGSTHDGRQFRAVGPVIINEHTVHMGSHNYHRPNLNLNANARVQIGESEFIDDGEIRFSITNFKFDGTRGTSLDLQIDGLQVSINQLPDYAERLKSLETSKGYDITSELIIPLSQCTLEKAIEIASRICDLLAIARGRRVNWIFYEICDTADEIVYTEHRLPILTPFTGFELIDHMPPENTKNFVEECYAHCSSPIFTCDLNTIANIHSNIHSGASIEARCLLICSMIDRFFLLTRRNYNKAGRNKKARRTTTRNKVKLVVRAYSVPIDIIEINEYKELRNSLVHELEFIGAQGSSSKQYLELLHFYDRIVLRILGYTGYYINWTRPEVWQGQQTDKLTPKKHV